MTRSRLILSLVLASTFIFAACGVRKDDASLIDTSRRVFGPLAPPRADSPELIRLGEHLYFTNALSVNRTQSCSSCHPVKNGAPGADGRTTSPGAHGEMGRRNSPTVLNADLYFAQFWDGRARTLEEQAAGPITNPVEMGMPDAAAVEERIRTEQGIDRDLFRAAFPNDPNPYTIEHAARAVAAFERTLRTHDRFDDFQNGNVRALTAEEKEGLRKFMSLGCTSCHNGPTLGARLFQRVGIVHPYKTTDLGRYEVTKNPSDEYVFKVPSLRNVALTKPYFHDGKIRDLPTAVDTMAWVQLGTRLEPKDRDAIVAFLKSLSDKSRS